MTLVKAARHLQEEIGGFSKEFYTKNHRWTEGLISAAKVVGIAANLLVDAADRCVAGDAKMEELIVASQEISAATAQLLVASKVRYLLNPLNPDHPELSNVQDRSKVSVRTGKKIYN